ncbi:hypothetical protein FAUST_5269 [Fusarium austroamericanum]|uniref:Uncharacterized protein n=1 Tax=Fusarium austroamericanum TaxID=282268 RepID=A0AAN6HFQ1_FUSAU|nr:hypothetical protein FAUST_5269 [Fusarium austroamericanum]
MDEAFLARLWAKLYAINTSPSRRGPLALDATTRALYERAAADPSSLSGQDRRNILERPSREEEESVCHEVCGLTAPELVAKAVQDPDSLSYREVDLIMRGFKKHKGIEDLWRKAEKAAKTKDELAAEEACWPKRLAWSDARNAAREAYGTGGYSIRRSLMSVPWQDHIMNSSASTKTLAPSGFVVFYTKDQEIDRTAFKAQLKKSVSLGLHRFLLLPHEPIIRGFKLHDTPHDSLESLQSHFVTMRDAGGIPTGLRQDAFLYVDDEASQSFKSERPFIWLWEPQEQSESQEQLGPVKVDIMHVAPLLLIWLTQRDMALEGRQLEMWRCKPDLEGFHKAAAQSRNPYSGKEHDGIWPPLTFGI